MIWKKPHISRIYEALTAIADNRIEINGNRAKCYEFGNDRVYDIQYDPVNGSIMSNDNSSYRKGELWYPSLALLLFLDVLDYQFDYGEALAGIEWKSLNTINNNNFDLTQQQVETQLQWQWINISSLHLYCDSLQHTLESLNLQMFGTTKKPPIGN